MGEAADTAIDTLRKQLGEDEMADAVLKRGARFFVTTIAAELLTDRNGKDFVARVGIDGLFAKAMKARLEKYATLAALMYVRIMRGLADSPGNVGTTIRRPETADGIRAGVREELISEKLAPEAYAEKLPKLPGIK